MTNAYFGINSTHPAYEHGIGYVCTCGHIERTKRNHNLHVIENHDKKIASEILDWRTYKKHYE